MDSSGKTTPGFTYNDELLKIASDMGYEINDKISIFTYDYNNYGNTLSFSGDKEFENKLKSMAAIFNKFTNLEHEFMYAINHLLKEELITIKNIMNPKNDYYIICNTTKFRHTTNTWNIDNSKYVPSIYTLLKEHNNNFIIYNTTYGNLISYITPNGYKFIIRVGSYFDVMIELPSLDDKIYRNINSIAHIYSKYDSHFKFQLKEILFSIIYSMNEIEKENFKLTIEDCFIIDKDKNKMEYNSYDYIWKPNIIHTVYVNTIINKSSNNVLKYSTNYNFKILIRVSKGSSIDILIVFD